MKILLIIILVFLVSLLLNKKIFAQQSCFENIDNKKFKEKMKVADKPLILDVRTISEYKEGSIKGAMNIDVLNGELFKTVLATLDKTTECLVYCRSGARSKKACNILCDYGFNKVYNLSSGYKGWN